MRDCVFQHTTKHTIVGTGEASSAPSIPTRRLLKCPVEGCEVDLFEADEESLVKWHCMKKHHLELGSMEPIKVDVQVYTSTGLHEAGSEPC